jgi:hypothetical protein
MAMTLEEISGLLRDAGIKHQVDEERKHIKTGWRTDNYKNSDGDKDIGMIIKLEEKGEFFKVFTPSAYKYKEGPSLLAVLETCMYVSWLTKMIQFEYDPSDGEIRAIIEFPLEDGKLTAKQLKRVLVGLVGIVDEYDPMIRAAIDTGKFVPKKEDESGMTELMSAMSELGPEEIKEVLEEI